MDENTTASTTPADPIADQTRRVISEQLGISKDEVIDNAKLVEDLGADSLDLVELVMALEDEFSLEIPDESAERMKTVSDAIKLAKDPMALFLAEPSAA